MILKMKIKAVFTIVILMISVYSFSQNGDLLTTKAKIIKIETKGFGKKRKNIATIKFSTKKGDSIETTVNLLDIPFLGALKNVGDEIEVNYYSENPVFAETDTESFISKYGMYILIILGIIFSIKPFLKSL